MGAILGLFIAALTAGAASRKKRNPALWGGLTFLGGAAPLLFLSVLPYKEDTRENDYQGEAKEAS